MKFNAVRGAWFCALAILLVIGLAMFLTRPATAQDGAERFSMEVVGEGPDVILIPGLSMPRETWDGTVEALSGDYRLHLLQVRGFGEPGGINVEPSPVLPPLVDELAAYIEAEGLEQPAVVGHSMGGLVALMLGAQYPQLPGKLLIVDALPWVGALYGGASADALEPQAATMRDALLATASEPMPEAAIRAETAGITDEANRALVAGWMQQADRRVTAQAFYDDMMADMREDIALIEAPVKVLFPWREGFPGRDGTISFYTAQYAALPAAELVDVPESGHFIMFDQPESFQTELESFLAD